MVAITFYVVAYTILLVTTTKLKCYEREIIEIQCCYRVTNISDFRSSSAVVPQYFRGALSNEISILSLRVRRSMWF